MWFQRLDVANLAKGENMPGRTLIPVGNAVFQQLVNSGRVSFPYRADPRDKVGDVVDVVNDDNPNQEVTATIERMAPTEKAGIFQLNLGR